MIDQRIMLARQMSERAHDGQLRKHIGEPYANHCHRVADMVRSSHCSVDAVCAAYLHDAVEDTDMTYQEIENALGWIVRDMVWELTTQVVVGENRAKRKARERVRLATTGWPYDVHTIKVADMLDNIDSIAKYEPNFLPLFLEEKKLLLRVLTKANTDLVARAWQMVEKYEGEKQENVGDTRLRDVL